MIRLVPECEVEDRRPVRRVDRPQRAARGRSTTTGRLPGSAAPDDALEVVHRTDSRGGEAETATAVTPDCARYVHDDPLTASPPSATPGQTIAEATSPPMPPRDDCLIR